MNIPCGRVLGHGDFCSKGHLCDGCESLLTSRDDALEESAKIADSCAEIQNDCESLGLMDPETGVRECSLDLRGDGCLCAALIEKAEEIAKRIRALKGKS